MRTGPTTAVPICTHAVAQGLANGLVLAEIGRRLGVEKSRVHRHMKRHAPELHMVGYTAEDRRDRRDAARVWIALRDWGGERWRVAA